MIKPTAVSLIALTSLCGPLALMPALSLAADSANDWALEEIVVSARMRSESLQDVPLSETAFSARQIDDARVDQVGDFIALTPNVTIAQSQSAGLSFLTIRGITQVRNGEPPVATVVDGVLQVNSRQFTQELFDVERIEVLRGPQGALYGRNATGGAILISTRQPTNELEGHVRAGIGRGNEYLAQGAVSGPVVKDKLLFRLAARYQDRDGYLENINLNEKADPYEDLTVRGLLKWNASDAFTVDLRASLTRTEGGAVNFQYQPAILGPDGVTLADGNFPFDFSIDDANLVDRKIKATNIGYGERDIDELSMKMDYDAGFATFTSITSYNELTEYVQGDQFPYTAAPTRNTLLGPVDGTQTQYVNVKAWSQEFRITSSADQRLRWMAGVYYLDTQRFISTTTGEDLGLGITRIEQAPLFADPVNPTQTFFADDNDNRAWAVFGNLAYDITKQVEASFAIRYDKDKRKQTVSDLNTGGVPGAINERTYDKAQPKVTLRWQPEEDINLYGSWGVGFRSGQFNQNGVGAAAALAGVPGVQDSVDQEDTETFELGFKTEFLNNRLRLNGALYRTKVTGQHYFVFVGPVGAQVLVNIDKVELTGGELEALAHITEGLDTFVSLGVTDSKVDTYLLNPAAEGNKSPYTPNYTFNAGVQYRTNITNSLGLFVRTDYERRGKQYWDPENTTVRSSLDLVRLRIGVEDPEGRWSVTGTVDNLFDEKYNGEYVLGGFASPANPRVWHVDVRYNF